MTSIETLFKKYNDNTLDNVETRDLIFQCGFYSPQSDCKTGFQLFDNSDNICFDGKIFSSQEEILEKISVYAKMVFAQHKCV